MRRMKKAMAAGAIAVAIVGTLSSGTASASPSSDPTVPFSDYPNGYTVYDVGCWTTFVPPAPHGGSMSQFYANCDPNNTAWVCPAVIVDGRETVYIEQQRLAVYDQQADNSDTAWWYYDATIPNGTYTTVPCYPCPPCNDAGTSPHTQVNGRVEGAQGTETSQAPTS